MCGIAGVIAPGRSVDRAELDRMCDTIVHRGPDSRGVHLAGEAGLAMQRLAIIDLITGDQPYYTEDGRAAVVFNGEIYNHEELRRDLERRGHRFAGGSDGEVIVHLWEDEGPRCVERLRGMFAFAVWDEGRRELFLARDRVGKKPLFYALGGGTLAFASEPRALLQVAHVPRTVDPRAIDAFLVNQYVPHHLSAFEHLRKLPPASTLLWRPGGEPRVERYWRLEYGPKRAVEFEDAAEELRALLLDATRMRMMSDVPLGAFLSGGVDSSAVVAAMAMSTADPVRTFSVSFPYMGFDEAPYARAVAERYGTRHQELEMGPPDPSLLPRIAWHFGEPFADPAALPTFQLSELTRRAVTVALNGDGGDESFAGYRRYWQIAATRPAEAVPGGVRRALARLAAGPGARDSRSATGRAARLARRLALHPAHRYADLFRFFTPSDRERLYGPMLRGTLASDPLEHVRRAWDGRPGLAWAERAMATDLDSYLPDDLLAKVDVTSMANSLELRSPLLDHELMEFGAQLPLRHKLRGREGKLLLREAVRPWLPDDVLDRPKHGFGVPIAHWLRHELTGLLDDVLRDPAARERGVFEPAAVERLIAEHRAGADRSAQLWAMLNLELWFVTCVDATPRSAAELPALS